MSRILPRISCLLSVGNWPIVPPVVAWRRWPLLNLRGPGTDNPSRIVLMWLLWKISKNTNGPYHNFTALFLRWMASAHDDINLKSSWPVLLIVGLDMINGAWFATWQVGTIRLPAPASWHRLLPSTRTSRGSRYRGRSHTPTSHWKIGQSCRSRQIYELQLFS